MVLARTCSRIFCGYMVAVAMVAVVRKVVTVGLHMSKSKVYVAQSVV